MTEEINLIIDAAKESMDNTVAHLEKTLLNIRAGKASPQMLGAVFVDYYGSQTPLSQVANVNAADARTLTVTPWEKNMLQPIEKAIMIANLGLNPMNNGDNIIINIPALTEERRKDLAKQAKSEADDAKVGIRNARKDANNDIKKEEKNGTSEDICKDAEERVQKLTDGYVKKIDDILAAKEAEIMKV
ncbi:ribosome recycling factor [Myroides odoratimimus]|uniref:ribosome recycling factor n=1 Tax=Myroides odoratimimus TaxID=76832 RepID=UPI0025757907|nr:ribosome recycling factor [Myroides odoratimimus]MDM1395772.1 ribosome recycling factor [Myroides odoratimimus]MDM1528259.1 ribosome recycling factor [Myroides odoratimimus]